MKSNILFLIILFFCCSLAQAQSDNTCDTNEVYWVVDTPPQFPGGETALMEYVRTKMYYPSTEMNCGIVNTIYLQFVIDTTGKTNCIEIIRPEPASCILQNGFGEIIVAMISNMPLWTSGVQGGKKVNVRMIFPIRISFAE